MYILSPQADKSLYWKGNYFHVSSVCEAFSVLSNLSWALQAENRAKEITTYVGKLQLLVFAVAYMLKVRLCKTNFAIL